MTTRMHKMRLHYVCTDCGSTFPKWTGQCTDCGRWNTLIQESTQNGEAISPARYTGYAACDLPEVISLDHIPTQDQVRLDTGLSELNRVLGGGIIGGSVVLIGGPPGIGKSTLLLQTLCHLSRAHKTLYITGEESLAQVKLRAERLQMAKVGLRVLAETQVERMLALVQKERPQIVVIDSVQTLHAQDVSAPSGSISQVKESTARWVRFAKQTGVCVFLVGHVTKEGALAGPRVLEHMVDTVLYFEGGSKDRFRMIRATKNRFGAVGELGIFVMTTQGLRQVKNPSAIFLSRYPTPISGSVVMVTWEGSRPLMVEVQALVNDSLGNARRIAVGIDQNRVAMLLAVLQRHGGVMTHNLDVFLNVVGGVRITETAADLTQVIAIYSSLKNKPLPQDTIVFGEIGLSGEIRPIPNGQARLKEAAKHGFQKAIVPQENLPKKSENIAIQAVGVHALQEALACVVEQG